MCNENESDELTCPYCGYYDDCELFEQVSTLSYETESGKKFPIVICPNCSEQFTFEE